MAEHCPTCGSAVRVVSADEGTSHYEPLAEENERLREVCARAARLAESERASMTQQVLREASENA